MAKRNKIIIDTSRIEEGDRFDNYIELCKFLNIEPKGGASKLAQMKEIKRYVEFKDTAGWEYIVEQVYSEPLPKQDKRKSGNNSIYHEHFELILLDYLARNRLSKSFNTIELTTNKILEITEMCNERFLVESYDEYVSTLKNISNFNKKDFKRRTNLKFTRMVNQMLTSLKSKFILSVKTIYKIEENRNWRTATFEEEDLIKQAKRLALDELGLDTFQDVYLTFKEHKFYTIVDRILYQKFKWTGNYLTHLIGFGDALENDIAKHLRAFAIVEEEKLILNEKVYKSIDNEAEEKFASNRQEIQEYKKEFSSSGKEMFRLPYNYIEEQKMLSEFFIKLY